MPTAEPSPAGLAEASLARARLAFIGMTGGPRGGALVVRNAKIVLLEPADFVAQPSGLFELEIGGGLAHPFLEGTDVSLEVVADEMRPVLVAGVDHDAVAGRQMGERIVGVAPNAFRRDAVQRVIFELLFAAPVGLVERTF